MAIDFPSSPSVGQQYTFNGVTYTFTAQGVWSTTGGGIGGSTGATDNAALRADGVGGSTVQGSALIIADTTGALSRSGNGGIPIQGTNTNDNASAGNVGEYISSTILSGSAVTLTSTITANITSISLTAGDWDIEGNVQFTVGSGAATRIFGSASSVSATQSVLPGGGGTILSATLAAGDTSTAAVTRHRVSLNATTTYYLVATSIFPSGTTTAFGFIGARRVR